MKQKATPSTKWYMGFAPIIILVLIALAVVGYFGYKNYWQKVQAPITTLSTPTDSAVSDKSQTTALSIRNLGFSIPKNWWSKKGKNDSYPIEWYDLNPTTLTIPYPTIPIFQVRTDKEDVSLPDKAGGVIKMWHLINVKSLDIFSGSLQGLKIQGTVDPSQDNFNSRFAKGAKVQIGLFIFGGNTYQILGHVSETQNRNVFDQILSTFKFTSSIPSPTPINTQPTGTSS
ncbi:MAG: hypothetical protein NT162_00020, partial [Candidatus Woesebacteria bacterium]|nr:hypothetical protein [Candidatus Woesebacteria bacterium]